MRKYFFIIWILLPFYCKTQVVLSVPTVFQNQTEWCWAGCTNSILTYYGFNISQCQIADYTRTVATWHNYGTTDCCINPSLGCNYWNYNWGSAGSMEDILMHFGSISDIGISNFLTFANITSEINSQRPFIIRWGWTSGGGHFIVGKGYDNSSQTVYYMNPWPGEGAKIATYSWLLNDGNHSWTHTNVLTTNPLTTDEDEILNNDNTIIFPNPVSNIVYISSKLQFNKLELYDITGKNIYSSTNTEFIDFTVTSISKGIYFIKLITEKNCLYKKIIIE